MGSYTENPTIPSIGGTTTNNKSANSTTSIMGANAAAAPALNAAAGAFLLFMADQLELKGLEIDNIANAAKAQSDAQIQAGKDQFWGGLAQGTASIVSGGFSAYAGYKTGQQNNEMKLASDKLKTDAPKILNDLAVEDTGIPGSGPARRADGSRYLDENKAPPRTEISKENFDKLLEDPTTMDPADIQKIKNENFVTPEQRQKLQETAGEFSNEKTQVQKTLKETIAENNKSTSSYQMWSRAGGELVSGGGTVVKSDFDSQVESERAKGTMDSASQQMASGAQDVISGVLSQLAQIIEILLQTQTQIASATTVR